MVKKHLQLSWAFFKTGMLGYGGGPSSIPLVHKEVVGTYKWMTNDEFSDVLALGNALPGPINTKMAGYIGYRVGGYVGMFTAIFSSILPTIILMIVLLTTMKTVQDQPWVQGMTRAVVPVVGVMMAVLTWQFVQQSSKGLGWKIALPMIAVSLVLLAFLNVHPAVIILVLLIAALVQRNKKTETQDEKKEERRKATS